MYLYSFIRLFPELSKEITRSFQKSIQ